MKNAVCTVALYVKSRKGQGLAEYALIIGLIAISLVSLLRLVPEPITKILTAIADALKITP